MDAELLETLEQQTLTLISAYEKQCEQNSSLAEENEVLKSKQGVAREKIQSMIQRLRLIENQS